MQTPKFVKNKKTKYAVAEAKASPDAMPDDSGTQHVSNFPLADDEHYSYKDAQRVLKRGLMDADERYTDHKRSLIHEWAGDIPVAGLLAAGDVNVSNIVITVASAIILLHLNREKTAYKTHLKDLIEVWDRFEDSLSKDRENRDTHLKALDQSLRKMGLSLEGTKSYDARHFKPARFLSLKREFNQTRTKTISDLREKFTKEARGLFNEGWDFVKTLPENIKDPHKFTTPKKIYGAYKEVFKLLKAYSGNAIHDLTSQAPQLRQAYKNRPDIQIQHWDRTIEILNDMEDVIQKATPRFAVFNLAALTLGMSTYGIITDSFKEALKGDWSPLIIHTLATIASLRPLKTYGHELEETVRKINSKRAHAAQDEIKTIKEMKAAQKHASLDDGLQKIAQNHQPA